MAHPALHPPRRAAVSVACRFPCHLNLLLHPSPRPVTLANLRQLRTISSLVLLLRYYFHSTDEEVENFLDDSLKVTQGLGQNLDFSSGLSLQNLPPD